MCSRTKAKSTGIVLTQSFRFLKYNICQQKLLPFGTATDWYDQTLFSHIKLNFPIELTTPVLIMLAQCFSCRNNHCQFYFSVHLYKPVMFDSTSTYTNKIDCGFATKPSNPVSKLPHERLITKSGSQGLPGLSNYAY